MPLVYIDKEGLAPYASPSQQEEVANLALLHYYPVAAGLPDSRECVVRDRGQRLGLLGRLRYGAGVRIVTGPAGKAYWGLASREVQVTVWPDNYDSQDRFGSELEWALHLEGAEALVASHLRKGKAPSARHKLYGAWLRAEQRVLDLRAASLDCAPLVHEDVAFEVLEVEDGIKLLENSTGTLALDWEWHRETKEPVGLAISMADSERNYYVPVRASDVDNSADGERLREAFGAYLRRGGASVLHGGRADLGTQLSSDPVGLLEEGQYVADDTMVMAYLLGETALGLKPLSRKFLGRDPIENDREWADESARFTGRYAAAGDTRNTFDLYSELSRRLALLPSQRQVYESIERPLVPVIASMEKYGTPVDIREVLVQYKAHAAIEVGLRRAVLDNYGRDLSDDTDTRRFIQDFGFADPGTLDQRVITLNPHWCIDLIIEYRRHRTRRRNFLKRVLQRWVSAGKPAVFAVYPRFNQAGSMSEDGPAAPRTGRLSSADPNLMNQPHAIRSIYVPPPGCVWWSYDYSGLELRIAAGLSQDPEMLKALTEVCPATEKEKCRHWPPHGDMHGQFQWSIQQSTGRDVGRVPAKTGNFEQLYEGSANTLVKILAKQRAYISAEDAQAIVDTHQVKYCVYHDWGKAVVGVARATGYAATANGRLRAITEYSSSDGGTLAHGDRAAQNHPVQGTGADIVKRKMVEIQPLLRKFGGHMCIQVHDEIDGWVPENVDLAEFDGEMKRILQDVEINGLKLLVEGGFGKNWSEAH